MGRKLFFWYSTVVNWCCGSFGGDRIRESFDEIMELFKVRRISLWSNSFSQDLLFQLSNFLKFFNDWTVLEEIHLMRTLAFYVILKSLEVNFTYLSKQLSNKNSFNLSIWILCELRNKFNVILSSMMMREFSKFQNWFLVVWRDF